MEKPKSTSRNRNLRHTKRDEKWFHGDKQDADHWGEMRRDEMLHACGAAVDHLVCCCVRLALVWRRRSDMLEALHAELESRLYGTW